MKIPRENIGCLIAIGIAGLLLLALSYGFGSPVHWSDDIRGTVIDEETGRPLGGAAIVAAWWLGGFSGSTAVVLYKTTAITAPDGTFTIKGMPPRVRPPLTWFRSYDPHLIVYRPGFNAQLLDNTPMAQFGYRGPFNLRTAKRRSYWDGKTIPLSRASPVDQAQAITTVEGYLHMQDIRPNDYEAVWRVLAEGYKLLPAEARTNVGDPQQSIDYWRAKKGGR